MFSDLVGSTELSQRFDPEDLREVMRRYQDAVVGSTARHGGHVAKFLGDGVLAYFGWPQAYEDQAERAVRAGLDVVGSVRAIESFAGEALLTRVGIATGQVVVGDFVGDAASEAEAVTGETPNLAARLQTIAGPNQVFIGETTRRLIGASFELEELGSQRLKGYAQAVPVWRVIGEGRAQSRFEAAHGAAIEPLVGREAELEGLLREWNLAKTGVGRVVVISGEAGIGKSRLLFALQERIADQDHFLLRFQCSAQHASTAFYPIIQRLDRVARFAAEDTPEIKREKVNSLLRLADENFAEVAPLFWDLMSLPVEEPDAIQDLTPQLRRERTIEALTDQVLALSRKRPLLFVLEDAHWIDPTTAELVNQTIARIENSAVLMLINHRPTDIFPQKDSPHLSRIELSRLDQTLSRQIVASTGGEKLEQKVIDRIAERADGVPLYLEELTKSVVEAGETVAAADVLEEIPVSLQASLIARLDRMGPAKEVMQIGAVIGRSFPLALIASLAGTPIANAEESLEPLVVSGLVSRHGEAPETNYTFRHALFQDVAYDTLLRRRQREVHARLAETLLEDFPEQAASDPGLIARHLSRAGQAERAAEYWLLAGQRAGEISAHMEAVAHLEAGLAELDRIVQSPARDEREFDLRIALGASLLTVEGWSAPNVASNYDRAQELGVSTGDAKKLFMAMRGQANVFFLNGEVNNTRRVVDRLLAMAEERQDDAMRLEARRAAGMCALFVGNFDLAAGNLAAANASYDRARHHELAQVYGTDPAVVGLSAAAWANWFLGKTREAMKSSEDALRLANELDHPFSLAYAQSLAASLHQFRGDHEAALRHADSAIETARENGYSYWLGWAGMMRGWAQAVAGDPEDGITRLRQGLEAYEDTGARQIRPYAMAMLAEMAGRAGRPDEGLKALGEAISPGNNTDVRFFEAEALRIGGLLERQAQRSDGGDYFRRALDMARAQGARVLELRIAVSAGRAGLEYLGAHAVRPVIQDLCENLDLDPCDSELTDAREFLTAVNDGGNDS